MSIRERAFCPSVTFMLFTTWGEDHILPYCENLPCGKAAKTNYTDDADDNLRFQALNKKLWNTYVSPYQKSRIQHRIIVWTNCWNWLFPWRNRNISGKVHPHNGSWCPGPMCGQSSRYRHYTLWLVWIFQNYIHEYGYEYTYNTLCDA